MAEDHPPATPSEKRERPLAERLAAYAHGLTYDDLDDATIQQVKTLLIDTIGCGVGAWDERPVRICRDIALSTPGPATVFGTKQRAATELAAFANAAAFRFLDFNDTYVGRFAVHPSDNIAACLAGAETERASARELIIAIVIAYEVNCRLVDALDISTRGWDPPVFGLPAVALAAGRLMKLSPNQLAHAVGIALNDHIPMAQTRVGALSDWKGLAAAEAGRNAVFAARLAQAGLSGDAFSSPGNKVAGRILANSPSSRRMPSKAASGRRCRSSASKRGSPIAPNSTALARLASASVSGGSGLPAAR